MGMNFQLYQDWLLYRDTVWSFLQSEKHCPNFQLWLVKPSNGYIWAGLFNQLDRYIMSGFGIDATTFRTASEVERLATITLAMSPEQKREYLLKIIREEDLMKGWTVPDGMKVH